MASSAICSPWRGDYFSQVAELNKVKAWGNTMGKHSGVQGGGAGEFIKMKKKEKTEDGADGERRSSFVFQGRHGVKNPNRAAEPPVR